MSSNSNLCIVLTLDVLESENQYLNLRPSDLCQKRIMARVVAAANAEQPFSDSDVEILRKTTTSDDRDTNHDSGAECERSDKMKRVYTYRCVENPSISANYPVKSENPCVRIIEHHVLQDGRTNKRKLRDAFLMTFVSFNLPIITRASERLRESSRFDSHSHPPCMDLTTLDIWQHDIQNSDDFQNLPETLMVNFEDKALDEKETIECTVYFQRVCPRRYVDCCMDTGTLFCYALKGAEFKRYITYAY